MEKLNAFASSVVKGQHCRACMYSYAPVLACCARLCQALILGQIQLLRGLIQDRGPSFFQGAGGYLRWGFAVLALFTPRYLLEVFVCCRVCSWGPTRA